MSSSSIATGVCVNRHLIADLKLWAASPRIPERVQLLILEAIGRLSSPSETAPTLTAEERRIAEIYESARTSYPGDQEAAGVLARACLRLSSPSAIRRGAFSLRHLQQHLPWTLPYSEHFEATAYPLDRVKHDVLHVMKSLGRIAAECENHDHGRDRKLIGDAFSKEVADLVICALHIAKLQGFDLQDAVVNNSEARNAASIPEEA